MSYVFAGDFYYKNDGNIGKADVEELMYFHYEFFKQQSNKFVTSGSILWCNAGSKISYFDLPVDHGVEREDGAPVGICSDCKINQNVYCFGGCSKTSPAGYPKRKTVIIDQTPSRIYEREKCIPMLNNTGWQKTTPSSLKIWDYVDKRFYDALTSGDFLTCFYGGYIRVIEVLSPSGSLSIPSDILSLMNSPIDSTWGISDSVAEEWFLSTNTAVIKKYGLNSTNIGEVTVAIKAAGVSPVLFYAYTVNEGGGLGGFINHYGKNYYANNGGDTAVNAASGDAQYLADQSKIMNSRPAWVDLGQKPPLRIDFVPQSVKDSGNASFASMPSGSIGRVYIPATAAATWEVYYPDGLLKSYNKVQNYGAPMKGVLSSIVAMSKY